MRAAELEPEGQGQPRDHAPRRARLQAKPQAKPQAKTPSARLGESGERLVALHLEARGLRIVARNWHCAGGEIDLIARDGEEWVFVEVKTRRGDAHGSPEEAITRTKARRVILAAQTYLMEQGQENAPYRIDVVAVHISPSGALREIRHYPAAITDEE